MADNSNISASFESADEVVPVVIERLTDADDDTFFAEDSGSVTKTGRFADQASDWWARAKSGYTKAKNEREADGQRVGTWEKITTTVAPTVAGVVGYRTTGSARPSAGLLVDERVIEVAIPKPRPIPDLFHEATEEVSGLVSAEVALVKTEIKQKAKIIGPAAGLLLAALGLLLFALPFFLWAAVFALHLVLPLWAATLIIAVVTLLVAIGLGFAGYKTLKRLGGLKSLAGGSIKEDIHAIIEAFKSRNWAEAQSAAKGVRL